MACFVLSSDAFRAGRTHRGLEKVSARAALDLAPATVDWVNHLLRKFGHFGGYALLALCLFRVVRVGHLGKRLGLTAMAVLAWCALDEYHQTWTRFRTGSPDDMLVDFAGACSALLAIAVVVCIRQWGRRPVVPS